jgi:type IV secretion system protein VirB5
MSAFNEAPKSFKPLEEPLLPGGVHLRAFTAAQDREVVLLKTARSWQKAFFLCLAVTSAAVAACVFISSQSSIKPYVIEVDGSGHARPVGYVHEAVYNPQEAEIKYFLNLFVQQLKSVPKDNVVLKRNLQQAYSFVDEAATQKLNSLMRKEQEKVSIGKDTLSVSLRSVTKVAGADNSYNIRWTETAYLSDGNVKYIENLFGIFTIDIRPPENEQAIFLNPLGIIITDLSWSKEI